MARHKEEHPARHLVGVRGCQLDILSAQDALESVESWARARESRAVCFCNVHVVISAGSDIHLANALQRADLVLPDGAPIAWLMRRTGAPSQKRIAGPDFMWGLLGIASAKNLSICLLGSTSETLVRLKARVTHSFPGLRILAAVSPPFRPFTDADVDEMVATINGSGAQIVFVGLGCPKQEILMSVLRGRVKAVMLGVGAAFDFHAGVIPRAPRWMQKSGLEWLHRLGHEPRRLAPRYIVTNLVFLGYAIRRLLAGGRGG